MPKDRDIYIPTGFESQQRAAERKRKIAQAMLERGLSTSPNMQSWLQVLAQMGSAFAGKRLDKKADKMSDEIDAQILNRRQSSLEKFRTTEDALDPSSPTYDQDVLALTRMGQDDPYLGDVSDVYAKGMEKRIGNQQDFETIGGRRVRKNTTAPGTPDNDPNSLTYLTPEGGVGINKARAIAGAVASGNLENPNAALDYVAPPLNAPTQPAQPAMPAGDEAATVWNNLDPQEKEVVGNILKKYATQGQGAANVPFGNPTDPNMGGKPPAGITKSGKPFWIVNGVPSYTPGD